MKNVSLLTSEILSRLGCDGVGWESTCTALPFLVFLSCLEQMLELKFGLWTWAFHVVLIQNSHSSLKLMASIFFKCIELPTRIWAFSLFTILMVWDRTWGKLLRLQDLKIQTMLKVVFLFFFLNKNFQSSSASHYPYFPLYCLSLKKCWPCPVVWYNSL